MSDTTTVRGARRAMIFAVIGSLTVAAVIGIVVLLGSDVGETAGRVRAALVVTLLAVATVAVMLIVPVLAGDWFGEGYTRLFGVVAIVDALGTIALPVLALVLRRADVVTTVRLQLDLPADLAARLDARAGTGSREAAVLEVLEGAL